MTIRKATASYEAWLGEQIPLLKEGLERKHHLMRSGMFPFLRATYYRWVQLWVQAPQAVRTAKEVLAVGDLHVENFGTWRDAEGRLVWGVNDFDEAFRLPYTNDLVRLATSARLAVAEGHLTVNGEVEGAILAGYREGLEAGGRPFVLAEHWKALRRMALEQLGHPDKFWDKLGDLPTVAADQIPRSAVKALGELLAEGGVNLRYAVREAGLGSLGRQRFVVIADWCGGKVAREAKALARSASLWATEGEGGAKALYREILDKAVRAQDPFVTVKRRWIARRLAPDCARIELAELEKEKEAERLLHAMGWETANVHLGSATAAALLLDLVSRPDGWLHKAVEEMLTEVREDWEAWKKEAAPAKN
ncbi:MAG TPA: hypothetical protein DD490_33820 [Acidobacteria bacterium]|nr:hypothetical protein [Acidobacteriota bacterium]